MPFSGLLELLGASTMICVFLAGLWKADELFSDEFREDVAIRLLLLKPTSDLTDLWILHVQKVANRLFGGRYSIIKISLISPIVTIVLSISLFLILIPSRFSQGMFFEDDFISVLILNVPMDIISLVISLILVSRLNRRNCLMILLFDIVLSGVVYFLWTYTVSELLIVQVGNIFGLWTAKLVSIAGNPFSALSFLISGSIETHGTWPYNSLIYFTTNFSTSILVWICIAGVLSLKLAHKVGFAIPKLQYILPIEKKPFRSIGIVGTVSTVALLLLLMVLLRFWSLFR